MRVDSRRVQHRFQLFGLGDVAGDGDLNQRVIRMPSSTVVAAASR